MRPHRFGKARSAECECTQRFTCGHCCRNAPPYFFTRSTVAENEAYARTLANKTPKEAK